MTFIRTAKQPDETGRKTSMLLLELLRAKSREDHVRIIDRHELADFPCAGALLFRYDEITELKAADKLNLRNELMQWCSDRS